jgi:beta-glucosidase
MSRIHKIKSCKSCKSSKSCLLLLLAFILLASQHASTQSVPPYKNPNLPIDVRVNDLVSRMTLDEKVHQMQNGAPAIERLGVPAYDW